MSDSILDKHLPPADHHRDMDGTDVVKSQDGVLHQDDLKLAHHVATHGTNADSQFLEQMEREQTTNQNFTYNTTGLTTEDALTRLRQYGRNEIPDPVDPAWLVFVRQFWAPMPMMIWIAIVGEALIANFADMVILLIIQFSNASISFYETTKAGNAVAALKASLKPTATCKRDGEWIVLEAAMLVPGDTILLASGSHVPADCRLNDSEIDVNQASLTGESLPVTFYKGDSCKMGSTVVAGEVGATVEFTGADTFFGKTASLIKNTHEPSHLQTILMTIVKVLVGISVVLCTITFFYLFSMGLSADGALSFTIVLLVASIPLAIEIVTTTTLAIGSKNLAAHGAIVTKLSAIEGLAGMTILCSDKTGTLTLNQMVLQEDAPIYAQGETQESLLVLAALAAKWKEPARDALDRLTLGAVDMALLDAYEQLDYVPFDPSTKRTEGTVRHLPTGEEFKTSKGAPHVILNLLSSASADMRVQVEEDVARLGESGIRSLAVAKCPAGSEEWSVVGLLTFLDPPRPDTKHTIREAREHGVQIKMITGDHKLIARNTALQLDLGDRIFTADRLPMLDPHTKEKPSNLSATYGDLCLVADGFAQVYPEHKYLIVECLREMGYTTGMTGDGVNDAPALKRADIGIAVAGATDAARASADIVLTREGLGTIIHGIVFARQIFQRMSNFITYRISATLQLLLFFFFAVLLFQPEDYQPDDPNLDRGEDWPEFFHMPVFMLMLITLLNDGTLITIAYDHAEASPTPNQWNLPVLFLASSVLGAVSCLSSLILLHILLNSWDTNGMLHNFGIRNVQYGQIITSMYLKVSVSDFLTLFSARTGPRFFWQVKPAPILLAGGITSLTISSIIAILWPDSTPDGILTEGLRNEMGLFLFVWIYCLVFWLIQDVAKVAAYKWMYQTNFRNILGTGGVVLSESAKLLAEELDAASGRGGGGRRQTPGEESAIV